MPALPLNEISAQEAILRVRSGAARVEEIAAACLTRIDAREPEVEAWAWLDRGKALAAARAIDARPRKGPLAGVVVGVKDIIDTADMPTGYGSPIYADHRPAVDAGCVVKLREVDALIAGKTVTTEFASFHQGKTRHPRDPAHSPGGSSSGSAAAIADRMVSAALGTQTAGSVIRPAAYCGMVGFKPTFGWLDRAGIRAFAESLDTLGVLTRTVADGAIVAGALGGRADWGVQPVLAAPPRLALCRTPYWDRAQEDGRAALDAAARRLAGAGASVVPLDLPAPFAALNDAQGTIMWWEARGSLSHERSTAPAALSETLRTLLQRADEITVRDYDAAQEIAAHARAATDGVFGDFDAVLTLSAPGSAPLWSEGTGHPTFNALWTLLHLPCITVPGMSGARGMPVGTQLIGRHGEDAQLLAAAAWVETALSPERGARGA